MNHDACHCSDYEKDKCPADCYHARRVIEYLEMQAEGKADFHVSWGEFYGTRMCVKKEKDNA